MQRGFKQQCESHSIHYREKLNLLPHWRLSAEALADYLECDVLSIVDIPGITQKDVDQLTQVDPRSFSAATVKVDDYTLIVFNPSHTSKRHESNVMHEIAHIVCGHKPIRIGYVPWFPFPLREFRQEDEDEAKWLGGCLQIPRVGLEWALGAKMTPLEISEHFGASPEMVSYRRNMTGIDIQRKRGRRRS